jgi:thiol-disulfide isomerase/thioredoxin
MNSLYKKAELIANIAIILVALLLGAAVVKRYFLASSDNAGKAASGFKEISAGEKFQLPDVDWSKNGQTLVLALSKNCRFCSESAPFYQKLVKEEAESRSLRLVAVFPHDVNQGKNYLDELGVSVSEIKQAPFNSIRIRGTPTLLLVNKDGVVVDVWVGKLPPEKEAEALSRLQGKTHS